MSRVPLNLVDELRILNEEYRRSAECNERRRKAEINNFFKGLTNRYREKLIHSFKKAASNGYRVTYINYFNREHFRMNIPNTGNPKWVCDKWLREYILQEEYFTGITCEVWETRSSGLFLTTVFKW